MHELSLAQAVADLVLASAKEQSITRIRRVTVVIGAWSAVQPDVLRSCFAMVTAQFPLLDTAELAVITQPVTGKCLTCGRHFDAEAAGLRCPACGSAARLVAGTDLAVDSYEGE